MSSFDNYREILGSLCFRTMKGELSLDDLNNEFPKELTSSFSTMIYNEIEEGIQHVPSFLFKKKIDFKLWHGFNEFFLLYLDYQLLLSGKSENELSLVHADILKIKSLDINKINFELKKRGFEISEAELGE